MPESEVVTRCLDPHELGRVVQEAWRHCASTMPNPPAAWLRSYDEVSDEMKEIDRYIGIQVAKYVLSFKDSEGDLLMDYMPFGTFTEESWLTKYDRTS